jgi:HAD superfamily hydrolase (TIGR01549 family)
MLSWIFFDVGNVILNDDPAQARAFFLLQRAVEERGGGLSLDALLRRRRELVREMGMEPTRPYFQILGKRLLGSDYPEVLAEMAADIFPRWGELSPRIPGMRSLIQRLKGRFHLGLIANQPVEAIDVLKGHGLWDCFSVHGISADVGFHKPDPGFFKWALELADCPPAEALMIGDRLDNDILPARAAGMKTLQLILPPDAKGFHPKQAYERAYIREKEYCHRHLRGQAPGEQGTEAAAESVGQILDAASRLSGKALPANAADPG